jgi:hypothetical protein
VCAICGEAFRAARRDAMTCSPACRQRLYRGRRLTRTGPTEPHLGALVGPWAKREGDHARRRR